MFSFKKVCQNVAKQLKKCYSETIKLNTIALYSMLTSFLDYGFLVVDIVMLGWLGRGQLASGIIGFTYYAIFWVLIEGVLSAQDTLVSRSFALNQKVNARYWSYIALLVVGLLCSIITVLFVLSPWIINYALRVPYHA